GAEGRSRPAPLSCRSGLSRGRTHGYTPNAGQPGIRNGGPTRLRRSVQWAFEHEDMAMSTKKPAADKEATTIVANDSEALKGTRKRIGGSQSDHWNNILANQTVQTLWLKHSDKDTRDRQYRATVAALAGIGPKDEIEGMMAAQLLAAHNAAMECYRRAMLSEQTFEGREQNFCQANKLSRTYAALLDALNRHRGKGQQKVTVEHVHVHAGGQAIVGSVDRPPPANSSRSENQHDARQITHAPQPAMRSPNAERERVPSASDAERAVADGRRNVAGATEGE